MAHQPVPASGERRLQWASALPVGLQAFWLGEGRGEAGRSCWGPRASRQAVARGFADDAGAWDLWEAQTEGEAFSGGALRVCTQISHTQVCVCRVCAHVRARLSVWRLTQVSVQAGTQSLFSFRSPGLFCDPMDCSPPVSSVHGILQTRTLEWVAILQGIFPHPGIKPRSLPQCRQILYRLNNHRIPL